MDDIEEIKSRLDIVNIISEYTKVQPAGQNFKARCPFHNEKTPSFMINQERQFYYCFGCNKGGDVFNFIQEIEGLEFPEALRLLAQKAGVTLKEMDPRAQSQKTRMFDLLTQTTLFWQENLTRPAGEIANTYLKNRGLNEQIINNFKIGYANDSWDVLLKFLKGKGFTETEIFQAGLIIKKDKGSGYYDRFRDRVMFPILDIHSNVIGFTGRALKDSEAAKYINSPETTIYHKSKVLYGLDKAKKDIKKSNFVVLVEGNMDVVSSHKIGVRNVVAVSGTALTDDQISLIKRFTNNIAFCFDMDQAGQNAAKRSIDMALENEMNIKIIQLVDVKDPDECIRKDPQAWGHSIETAKSIMQYHFDRVFSETTSNSIENKKKIVKLLLPEIVKIRNVIERDYWLRELGQKIDVAENLLREALPRHKEVRYPLNKNLDKNNAKRTIPKTAEKKRDVFLSELLLTILIRYPLLIKYAVEHLSPEAVKEELRILYKKLIFWYTENSKISHLELLEKIKDDKEINIEESYLNSLYLLVDKHFEEFEQIDIEKDIVNIVQQISKNYYQIQINLLEKQISESEKQGQLTQIDELISKLQDLTFRKNNLF